MVARFTFKLIMKMKSVQVKSQSLELLIENLFKCILKHQLRNIFFPLCHLFIAWSFNVFIISSNLFFRYCVSLSKNLSGCFLEPFCGIFR